MTHPCVGPFSWALGVAIIVGIAIQAHLWNYLQDHHPATWEWLGSPVVLRPKLTAIKTTFYTNWFVFSGMSDRLNDAKLNRIVWVFRLEYALIIGLIVWGKTHGWMPPACATTSS